MAIAISDVDKDNNLDLIIAQYNSHLIEVCFGNGAGDFYGGTAFTSNLHPISVAAGDFDNDTNLDFVSVSSDY